MKPFTGAQLHGGKKLTILSIGILFSVSHHTPWTLQIDLTFIITFRQGYCDNGYSIGFLFKHVQFK